MTTHRKQRVTAIVTLLFTIALVGISFAPNLPGYEFSQMTAIAAAILAAVLAFLTLAPKRPAAPADEDVIPWGMVWPLLLMLLAFLLVMEWLGFFTTSFITFLLITFVYSPQRLSVQRVIRTTAVAVLFMGGLYFIFVVLLRVQVPSGILV